MRGCFYLVDPVVNNQNVTVNSPWSVCGIALRISLTEPKPVHAHIYISWKEARIQITRDLSVSGHLNHQQREIWLVNSMVRWFVDTYRIGWQRLQCIEYSEICLLMTRWRTRDVRWYFWWWPLLIYWRVGWTSQLIYWAGFLKTTELTKCHPGGGISILKLCLLCAAKNRGYSVNILSKTWTCVYHD